MSMFHLIYGIFLLLLSMRFYTVASACASCCPYQFFQQGSKKFEQKTDRFWKFSEETDKWIEVKLPCDLVPCVSKEEHELDEQKVSFEVEENLDHVVFLPLRNRISLTKMSETSVWVTGESGCIYERFWNGLEWVIAPHDLPISAGRAIAIFVINQRILALSEAGNLYQQMHVQLGETSQPVWVEFTPTLNQITDNNDPEKNPLMLMKSVMISDDGQKAYFCTKKGTLVELAEFESPRWINHGQPAGANVAAIANVASTKEVVYTISSTGDLYEYNSKSKPSWKRHIWQEKTQFSSLIPSKGCILHGLSGDHSESLFLLTKEGTLVERRLYQRKWKWIVHGSPQHQNLTAITPALRDESSETSISLFFTTSSGSVFEYQIPKQLGTSPNNQFQGSWANHQHPLHAKAARGIPGLPLQIGRILFALDDGRLAELHLVGLGGENSGPSPPQNYRRKSSTKYVWSILDAPESEGWNAEYCTEERGPRNCMTGIKDESKDSGITSSVTGRRKQSQEQHYYLSLSTSNELINYSEEYSQSDDWIRSNFHLRLMYEGKSFFLVTNDGLIFEHVCVENVWIWLRHDSSTAMNGIVGNYNGSLFMVDTFGSLLLREWSGNEIAWKNCTDMRKGRNVVGGQPWDRLPGITRRVTTEDSLFFVSQNGRLLQFMVYMRKFKWKDCKNPPNVKIACIVDQELFRENIIFVTGRNGHLYQYNKVTDLWHEHYQSQHLILSQFPGTVIRPLSKKSLSGSLFMLSNEGGLVEYHWNRWHGWNWIEHGTPYKGVTLVGSPGPSFKGNQLLLIGSDGKVYLRYMDKNYAWKWKDFDFPSLGDKRIDAADREGELIEKKAVWIVESSASSMKKKKEKNLSDLIFKCDPKVASTRPIPFSEDSAIFELRDGRLAEIQLVEETEWAWSRIIGTPNSLCSENYWITVKSS